MSNLRGNFEKKMEEKRTDIQAIGTITAVLAAVYFLGKSRGRVTILIDEDVNGQLHHKTIV